MKKEFFAGLSMIALLALSAPALASTGKQDREVAAVDCFKDYSELKNTLMKHHGRVMYVNDSGTARLSAMMEQGEFGPIDQFIIATNEDTRTMNVLMFKCSKLVKSWVDMSVEEFDQAQRVWQIVNTEMKRWGEPSY